MKLALIADIHGNYNALEAVLEDISRQAADRIVVLGDLVFKGPQPEKCVQTIRELQTHVIRGNIDELVGTGVIPEGFAKSANHTQAVLKELEWNRARLPKADLAYLAGLPFEFEEELNSGTMLHCVHATPQNVLDVVTPEAEAGQLERMFANKRANVVAYAHIHLPYMKFQEGKAIVNTGSVGLPFDGDPRASYALLDWDDVGYCLSIRRVRYDIAATVRAFHGSGHPFAESVIAALKAGRRPT